MGNGLPNSIGAEGAGVCNGGTETAGAEVPDDSGCRDGTATISAVLLVGDVGDAVGGV